MQHVLAKAAAALGRAETPNAQKLLASAALCLHLAAPHCPFTTRWLAQAAYQHAQPTSSSVPSSQSYNSRSSSSSRPDGEHASSRGSALSVAVDRVHSSAGYEQWAAVAQLGKADAEQLLQQRPALWAYLSGQLFLATNYHVNMACLSLHPDELSAQQYAALRGALALLPPSMLQVLLDEQPRLQDLLEAHHKQRGSRQEQHQQQQSSQHVVLQRLQQQLLDTLGPVRSFQQQQQQWQQARQHMQQQQQQQPWLEQSGNSLGASWQQQSHVQAAGQRRQEQRQQYHHHHHHNFQQVAEAVVTALGLQPDQLPQADGKLLRLLRNVAAQAQGSSSSSSSPSSPNSSSSGSGAHFTSAVRPYTTSPCMTTATGLAWTLERKAQAVHLRDKPIHDADSAAQFAQQLQQTTRLGSTEVLELLLQRPVLLWQHSTPCLPGQLLTDLQQLLPALDQGKRLASLVRRQPRLLSCRSAELQGVVDMLATRLQLSQEQVAKLVVQHPQLLVQPVKSMLLNVALLVGLGFTPSDLQAMAIKNPLWLTKSLRDLTLQWHFIQQVVKVRPGFGLRV